MSLSSTYHLQQSLPNRSSSTRPRSVSLSEYQPLSFDRDASAAQYQQALAQPSSSSSSRTRPSHGSIAGSTDSHQSPSTLTRDLRPGDVPIGMAGVGAGHCLTPPHSPFHKPAQLQQEKVLLSPIPPTPPLRPTEAHRASPGYFPQVPPRPRAGKGRDTDKADYEQNGEGYASDPGHSIGNIVRRPSRRQLRQLPPIPTNVPQPVSIGSGGQADPVFRACRIGSELSNTHGHTMLTRTLDPTINPKSQQASSSHRSKTPTHNYRRLRQTSPQGVITV